MTIKGRQILICWLKSVTYLVVFQFFDSFVFLSLSFGLDRIWPLGYAGRTDVVKFFALIESHSSVILLLVCLRAHTLNSLKFVNAQDSGVLGYQRLMLTLRVGFLLSLVRSETGCTVLRHFVYFK